MSARRWLAVCLPLAAFVLGAHVGRATVEPRTVAVEVPVIRPADVPAAPRDAGAPLLSAICEPVADGLRCVSPADPHTALESTYRRHLHAAGLTPRTSHEASR